MTQCEEHSRKPSVVCNTLDNAGGKGFGKNFPSLKVLERTQFFRSRTIEGIRVHLAPSMHKRIWSAYIEIKIKKNKVYAESSLINFCIKCYYNNNNYTLKITNCEQKIFHAGKTIMASSCHADSHTDNTPRSGRRSSCVPKISRIYIIRVILRRGCSATKLDHQQRRRWWWRPFTSVTHFYAKEKSLRAQWPNKSIYNNNNSAWKSQFIHQEVAKAALTRTLLAFVTGSIILTFNGSHCPLNDSYPLGRPSNIHNIMMRDGICIMHLLLLAY